MNLSLTLKAKMEKINEKRTCYWTLSKKEMERRLQIAHCPNFVQHGISLWPVWLAHHFATTIKMEQNKMKIIFRKKIVAHTLVDMIYGNEWIYDVRCHHFFFFFVRIFPIDLMTREERYDNRILYYDNLNVRYLWV